MTKRDYSDWESTITHLKHNSQFAAMAWFNSDAQLIEANNVMLGFLDTTSELLNPKNLLINPDFNKLKQLKPDENGLVFDGLLTIGNYSDVSFVLHAKVFVKLDVFFIYGEADALSMFEENKQMSKLNQQVNNLQRQLIKEKVVLEKTLRELKETQQMLIHSEKMNALGQMVAGITHEINNPIAFVINNLSQLDKFTKELFELLSEIEGDEFNSQDYLASVKALKEKYEYEFLKEDITDIIEESYSGVIRVKKIVADLRRFSRLDESDSKNIDLYENIQSTLSIVKAELDKKSINFEFSCPDKLFLDCFPGQLNQALLNLLINAVYAVECNGNIQLKISDKQDYIEIIIKDNGCGIPEESIDKIFNPFFTTKPIGSGTGLGLSITYKIIKDLHGGSISVKSELGKGTLFIMSLPKNKEQND